MYWYTRRDGTDYDVVVTSSWLTPDLEVYLIMTKQDMVFMLFQWLGQEYGGPTLSIFRAVGGDALSLWMRLWLDLWLRLWMPLWLGLWLRLWMPLWMRLWLRLWMPLWMRLWLRLLLRLWMRLWMRLWC
jgi:hypothetical protein